MLVLFEDLIWVAQNATRGNVQGATIGLATLFTLAVLAIRQGKKLDLQNCPLSCSRKECLSVLSVVVNRCNTVLAIYSILSCTVLPFATGFHCC
jgi:hypothetical protein